MKVDEKVFLDKLTHIYQADIALDTQLQDLASFDSLTFMTMSEMLKKDYGLQSYLQDILACQTPQDLLALIEKA